MKQPIKDLINEYNEAYNKLGELEYELEYRERLLSDVVQRIKSMKLSRYMIDKYGIRDIIQEHS